MDALCSSAFVGGHVTIPVAIPPAFIRDGDAAARQALTELLMKYHAGLGGILLAFAKARYAAAGTYADAHGRGPVGRINDELPVIQTRIAAEVLLFRPQLGQILRGTVNSLSEGHVGCLLGGLFNASVLRDDMSNGYAFDDVSREWKAVEGAAAAAGTADAGAAAGGAGKKRSRDAATEWEAIGRDANRILSANPKAIALGSVVAFRVKAISYSGGVISLHGSFQDEVSGSSATGAPAKGGKSGKAAKGKADVAAAKVAAAAVAATAAVEAEEEAVEPAAEEPAAPAPVEKKKKAKKSKKDKAEE